MWREENVVVDPRAVDGKYTGIHPHRWLHFGVDLGRTCERVP